jgi:ElaB/YqjD/DUF883 family membrane-anchored ribosome-binding protein
MKMPIQNKSALDERLPEEARQGNVKYTAPAFEDIRRDLNSLQSDVAHLAVDVRKVGSDKARDAVSYVNEQIGSLKETGTGALGKIEDGIRSKPGQSVTVAFVAGMLASYLFGRRY